MPREVFRQQPVHQVESLGETRRIATARASAARGFASGALVLRVIQRERPHVGRGADCDGGRVGPEERRRAEDGRRPDPGDHLAAAVLERALDLGGPGDQEGEMVVGLVLLQEDGAAGARASTRASRMARLLSGSTSPSQGAAIKRWVASGSIISQPRRPARPPRAIPRRREEGDVWLAVRRPGWGRGRRLKGSTLLFTLCRRRQS